MTLETMHAVAAALTKRGLNSTCEYPGYIQTDSENKSFVSGDAGGVLACNVLESDGWNESELAVSDIPNDSTDVEAITSAIYDTIRGARGNV